MCRQEGTCTAEEAAVETEAAAETPTKDTNPHALQEEMEESGDLTPGSSSSQDIAALMEESGDLCPGSSSSQDIIPLPWQPPLPVLALQARLQGASAPPRWAAWLPANFHQAPCSGAAQMIDGSFGADSQIMSANTICDINDIDMSTRYVTPDGMILQPVILPIWGDADESTWPDAGSNWADTDCYQYGGMQLQQEYAQLDEPVQNLCSIGPMTGRVWKLSQDIKGCRQVQDALEAASCDQERIAIAAELHGHVWQALKCGSANHVIQKCISTMKPCNVQFVIDELTHHGTGGGAQAARHRFGCRIIERLLEHCSEEQLFPLVEEILPEAAVLSSHIYGYYVIQHLLEYCGPDVAARICSTLEQNLCNLAPEGYAGAVIGTALSKGSNEASLSLATALLKDPARSATMACSRWGHPAVKHALQLLETPLRNKACHDLMWYSGRLRSNRYGRLVAGAIAEQQNAPMTLTHRGAKAHSFDAGLHGPAPILCC